MIRSCALTISWVLVAALGAAGNGAAIDQTTATDHLGLFSITYPAEWSSAATSGDAHTQVALFASAPFDISIVAASRPLDRAERALDPTDLLDELVLVTVDNQKALGNRVIAAGLVDPLVAEWPAFSVVATDAEQRKMITCWRFVGDQRLYTLTTMTDNSQASPELGAAVRRVIESFRLLD